MLSNSTVTNMPPPWMPEPGVCTWVISTSGCCEKLYSLPSAGKFVEAQLELQLRAGVPPGPELMPPAKLQVRVTELASQTTGVSCV